MKLTTHLRLDSRLRIVELYLHSLYISTVAVIEILEMEQKSRALKYFIIIDL
jgi:hypothetical protein